MTINSNIYDIWLNRISSLITIVLFLVQFPFFNDYFTMLFNGTSVPFRLLVSSMLMVFVSFFLNKICFDKGVVAVGIISTVFLANVANMLSDSLFGDLTNMGIIFLALAAFDGLGLVAANIDSQKDNTALYGFLKVIKIVVYIIFIFLVTRFNMPIS